ncbi:MAG TPA: hypothetical protein VN843_31840 [Anaerolineales bacterium]|nr:hypothetical protein [Anaerolineales bacterium]
MKIIRSVIVPLFLVLILAACNTAPSTPTTSLTEVLETAIPIIKAEITMTQTAIPTITPMASTIIPSGADSNGPVPPPAEELDYAMSIAPKIYTLLPYINETVPYGEYSGCTETFDFRNYVGYIVKLPMEIVDAALLGYFSTEKWEFTQAVPGDTARTITYDVYRISSADVPALERLRVILTDETVPNGEAHIRVRAELAHVETKENFPYLLDPFACYDNKAWWLWIRLTK